MDVVDALRGAVVLCPRMKNLAAACAAFGLVGLGCAPNLAAHAAGAPSYDREAKCGVTKSQSEPLIVEWPSSARAKIEALTTAGVVAVRYTGCEMEVLAACGAPAKYAYTAITPKRDKVTIKDEDELYATIPLGAARLESKLAKAGSLDVKLAIVGRKALPAPVRADDLAGPDCARATHVVSALTVGAFEFYAGAEAQLGAKAAVAGAGASGASATQRELLNADGTMSACDAAKTGDKAPPEGCGAVVRLEVSPIAPPKGEAPRALGAPASGPTVAHGAGGELRFEVPDKDQSFNVTVDAGGTRLTCAQPVTYYKACKLYDVPQGRATVHVSGDASFDREVPVSDEGRTEIVVAKRGWAGAAVLGGLTAASGVVVAYGLADSNGFQGTGHTLDIILVTVGGTCAFVFGLGLLGEFIRPHEALVVTPPGKPAEVARWTWTDPMRLDF
jgi:hypothetical protein